jgi:hypothetical protein
MFRLSLQNPTMHSILPLIFIIVNMFTTLTYGDVCTSSPCQNGATCLPEGLFACDSGGDGAGPTPARWYAVPPATGGTAILIGSMVNLIRCENIARSSSTGIYYTNAWNTDEDTSSLYSINPTTGVGTLIGANVNNGPFGVEDLAFNNFTGVLYGLVASANWNLYSFNVGTGADTFIGNTGISAFGSGGGGMFFFANVMYASFSLPPAIINLYTINLSTGAATLFIALTGPLITACDSFPNINDFTVIQQSPVLIYGWFRCNSPFTNDQLIRLNLNTGVVQAVGSEFDANPSTSLRGIESNVNPANFSCICPLGYFGTQCQLFSACLSAPCQNGATCTTAGGGASFVCTCVPGYSGSVCQTNVDECGSNPCQNGGTCNDVINGFTCTCSAGYSGNRCQTNINECVSLPCRNGATCIDGTNQFTCSCIPGYSGIQCQTEINECGSNPCQNDGTCLDFLNSYVCVCALGFDGLHCELSAGCQQQVLFSCGIIGSKTTSDWFRTDPVSGQVALIGDTNIIRGCSGIAQQNTTRTIYVVGDSTGSGNIALFTVAPLTGSGTLVGLTGTASVITDITFQPGTDNLFGVDAVGRLLNFTLTTGEVSIIGNTGLSEPVIVFVNGTLYALSNNGNLALYTINVFTAAATLISVVDTTEITNTGICPDPGTRFFTELELYQNTVYGWIICEDPHGLAVLDIPNAKITNVHSDPDPGQVGLGGADIVLCNNNGTCIDNLCQCLPGFAGTYCDTIVILACSSTPCQNGGTCIEGNESFTCQCVPGYSGYVCETEIDECVSNPCQNGGTCVDGINSFTCNCSIGASGVFCEITSQCNSNSCANGGTCISGINTFTCQCVAGFSGEQCQTNIDECASNPCNNGGTCTDVLNGFTCACIPGTLGITCETNINECVSDPCENGGTCVDNMNGYNCLCASGFSGTLCETNIDECASNPCLNQGTCIDHTNGYECICLPGYSGSQCENSPCVSSPCFNAGTCSPCN